MYLHCSGKTLNAADNASMTPLWGVSVKSKFISAHNQYNHHTHMITIEKVQALFLDAQSKDTVSI